MRDALIALLLLGGVFFALVAAIGVVRLPDIYMRLSAASKASTMGSSLILSAVALFFWQYGRHRKGGGHHRLYPAHRTGGSPYAGTGRVFQR